MIEKIKILYDEAKKTDGLITTIEIEKLGICVLDVAGV